MTKFNQINTSKCSFDVDVDMNVDPNINCHPKHKRDASFDIELDFDINPHCDIVKKKDYCGNGCAYTVNVGFGCRPKIRRSECSPCTRGYSVDVNLDCAPECSPAEKPKVEHTREACDTIKSFKPEPEESCGCPRTRPVEESKSRGHYNWDDFSGHW